MIARIVDGSDFLEFKEGWGKTLITGHATIQGYKVGILGNNGPIFSESANKATQFIQICSQSNTPLIFLQNITGFMVGTKEEAKGMIRHGSKMIQAVTNCTVPKITLRIGASFGAGEYGMAGKIFNSLFFFSWAKDKIDDKGGGKGG